MKHEFDGMGSRIRMWRKDQGIKGFELARVLQISSGSLSEIETGKSLPSASTLASIHQNTDLNVGYVLTGQVAGEAQLSQTLLVEVADDIGHVILKRKKESL